MKKVLKLLVPGLLAAVLWSTAYAQFAKPEDAIAYRRSVMVVIGRHIGSMGAVVKGQAPYDKAVFAKHASLVATMAGLPWEASLVPGSDRGDTTLKSSAFEKKQEFMAVATQFQDAAQELSTQAANGDLSAIKAQFGQVVGTCKACHSAYRK